MSLGPVQGFIASARKTEDLWGGSYLLSYLAEQAMLKVLEVAQGRGMAAEMVFPRVSLASLRRISLSDHAEVASLPNRFTCWVEGGKKEAADLARIAEGEVRGKLKEMVCWSIDRVFAKNAKTGYMKEMGIRQGESLLEVYWAVEPVAGESDYHRAWKQLEKRLAAVKNSRPFGGEAGYGLICRVCGEHTSLVEKPVNYTRKITYHEVKRLTEDAWEKRHLAFKPDPNKPEHEGRIPDGEHLCAVCLTKRLLRDYMDEVEGRRGNFKSFPSTSDIALPKDDKHGGYLAVILMDGDNMGRTLAEPYGKKGQVFPAYHQDISSRLSDFSSNKVPSIIEGVRLRLKAAAQDSPCKAVLVYAGGDDVLALVPVTEALNIAQELRRAYLETVQGVGNKREIPTTASIGMAIGHEKAPLSMLLAQARAMERAAKNYRHPRGREKNALGLSVIAHTGEVRQAVLPWGMVEPVYKGDDGPCAVKWLKSFLRLIQEDLSSNFVYTFKESFWPLLDRAQRAGQGRLSILQSGEDRELIFSELHRLVVRSVREGREPEPEKLRTFAYDLVGVYDLMPSTLQFIHLMEMAFFFKRKGVPIL